MEPKEQSVVVSIPYGTTNELNVISHIFEYLLITEQQVRDCLVKFTVKVACTITP